MNYGSINMGHVPLTSTRSNERMSWAIEGFEPTGLNIGHIKPMTLKLILLGGRIGRVQVLSAGDRGFEPMIESNHWLIKLILVACCFLARLSALLGSGKDWLEQFQDNVTRWNIRSWFWRPGLPMGQYYKVGRLPTLNTVLPQKCRPP